jgi:polysaccharide export outer membrane protein
VFRILPAALALAGVFLSGCSGPPLRRDVIAQARPGDRIAFDVVKIDDRVVRTLLGRKPPPFRTRFAAYQPPPELKIALGDVISVVIWEAGPNGLFGTAPLEFPGRPGTGEPTPSGAPEAPEAEPGAAPLSPGGEVQRPEGGFPVPGAPQSGAPGAFSEPLVAPPGFAPNEQGAAERAPGAPETRQGGFSVPGAAPGIGERATRGRRPPAESALLEGAGGHVETRIPDQTVGQDGAITVPYAGRIKVAGLTPAEVQTKIEDRLASRALNPQALVVVKRSPANSVSVEGEKLGGARVTLPLGGARMLQVIAAAGGAQAPPHETFMRLSRGGATATVPLATLIADPKEDIFARPGDVLTLVHHRKIFSIFGATGKNTTLAFNSEHLSLSEALAKAGGLNDRRADPRAVFLFRYEPVALVRALGEPPASFTPGGLSPVAYRLDLHDAKSYLLARRFPVHEGDVIFVADAASRPIRQLFIGLSEITGPIETGFVTCQYATC